MTGIIQYPSQISLCKAAQAYYKPEDFGVVKHAELHHFSDASQSGFGQSSYLRLVSDNGQFVVPLPSVRQELYFKKLYNSKT